MVDTIYCPKIMPPSECHIYVEIDLKQIKKNYNVLSQMSKHDCGAVVKSDGYGLGAGPISEVLYKEGCRHFFVTNISEGISLREKYLLPKYANLYIFNGMLENTEELLDHYQLIPVLLSLEQMERWKKFATTQGKKVPAVIHIDTGMFRTGLCGKEQKILYQNPELLDTFNIHFIMSHLACSNQPDNPQNIQQLKNFTRFTKYFPGYSCSLAASIGMALGTQYHFDLTRPGFGIYGETKFLPNCYSAVQLWTKIIQIRSVEQGSYIGYGTSYQCLSPKRLAILNIGFADTWIRPEDQQIGLSLHDQEIPLLGISSMDLLIADITSFPEGIVRVGDWVQLLGPNMPLYRAAEISGTTPAKILTSLIKLDKYRIYI